MQTDSELFQTSALFVNATKYLCDAPFQTDRVFYCMKTLAFILVKYLFIVQQNILPFLSQNMLGGLQGFNMSGMWHFCLVSGNHFEVLSDGS